MAATAMKSSKRRWVIIGVLVLLLATVQIVVLCSRGSPRRAIMAALWRETFNRKYLKQVSFPLTYDGEPSPKAPPEKRAKIVAVHHRYWENFAQIDSARFRYTCRTSHEGPMRPGSATSHDWDMNAQVEMRYAWGLKAEGSNSTGEHFEVEMSPERERLAGPGYLNLASLAYHFFGAYLARPEVCGGYDDIQENVAREGDPSGKRYDVLLSSHMTSELPGHVTYVSKDYFDRDTGMLEIMEQCDPTEMRECGRYETQRFSYVQCDGVYIPKEFIADAPWKGNRIVETYSDIRITKRDNPSAPSSTQN